MQAVAMSGLAFVENLAQELTHGDLELPAFPDAAERIRRALDDPDCAPARLARVVGADAGLAAQIMRMANSALYNARGFEITNLQVAIGRLGQDALRSAATAMAMRQLAHAAATPALKQPLGRLWKHSMQVAAVAFTLAKRQPHLNRDEAMLAGLVHDIGELYILKRAAEEPGLLEDKPVLDELIENWHTGVGRAIVDAWGFPESVVTAVDEHEELGRDPGSTSDLTSAVMVANLIAKLEAGEITEVDWQEIPAFTRLGLDEQTLATVLQESAEEIRSMIESLKG